MEGTDPAVTGVTVTPLGDVSAAAISSSSTRMRGMSTGSWGGRRRLRSSVITCSSAGLGI